MVVTIIRVNPESVQAYGSDAEVKFEEVRSDLEMLVADVVEVRYFGPNAGTFKTQAGELAQEYSQALLADLGAISESVSQATSAIADSLGGAPIRIAVNGSAVTAPAVDAGDGSVDVDTSALEALKPVVQQRFQSVSEKLDAHLTRLEGTDWEGNAKERAVSEVTGFTSSGKERSEEAQQSLTQFIESQIMSVTAADK